MTQKLCMLIWQWNGVEGDSTSFKQSGSNFLSWFSQRMTMGTMTLSKYDFLENNSLSQWFLICEFHWQAHTFKIYENIKRSKAKVGVIVEKSMPFLRFPVKIKLPALIFFLIIFCCGLERNEIVHHQPSHKCWEDYWIRWAVKSLSMKLTVACSTNLGGSWTLVGNLEATNYTQLGISTVKYPALTMNHRTWLFKEEVR